MREIRPAGKNQNGPPMGRNIRPADYRMGAAESQLDLFQSRHFVGRWRTRADGERLSRRPLGRHPSGETGALSGFTQRPQRSSAAGNLAIDLSPQRPCLVDFESGFAAGTASLRLLSLCGLCVKQKKPSGQKIRETYCA